MVHDLIAALLWTLALVAQTAAQLHQHLAVRRMLLCGTTENPNASQNHVVCSTPGVGV